MLLMSYFLLFLLYDPIKIKCNTFLVEKMSDGYLKVTRSEITVIFFRVLFRISQIF